MTHKIPSWLKDHCLNDLNSHYDWMNKPFLHKDDGDEEWAVATNSKGCVAIKLPSDNPAATPLVNCVLSAPKNSVSTMASLFNSDLGVTINVDRLITELAQLTMNCTICKNTKFTDCGVCTGSTEITCRKCSGKGANPCVTCKKPDLCKECDGIGVIECVNCEQGQAACICTTQDRDLFIVKIDEGHFNLRLLEPLLKNITGNCKLKVTTKPLVAILRSDEWLVALSGVNHIVGSYPAVEVDLKKLII